MKQTEHYRMYAEVFGIDVPLTQSQSTDSTQGTHRTPSAPMSPNSDKEVAESSAPRRSTVIRLRIPKRRSTRLTPPAPVPTVDKADEMILQDTLQVSLAEHKGREEQEARENVALVDEHLAYEEIEKMVDGQENIESPEVEITKDKEVEITNVVIPVNVNDDDEEITDEVYELKRREKGKLIEETRNSPIPTPIRSPRIHTNLLQGCYGYLFAHLRARFMPRKSFDTLADNLHDVMVETLPDMDDKHIKEQVVKQVPEQVRNQVPVTPAVRPRDHDDPHDNAHPEGENSAKQQKTLEYEAYVSGESSSGQVFQEEQAPSTSGNQEQNDDFDFWTDSYVLDDDEIPSKQVSQEIMEEVLLTIDEAKLRNMADEMLRRRCTSGDEHQYHIDQMKNFLKSAIVFWGESRERKFLSLHIHGYDHHISS
ncbi:hypothetical protein Tco_0618487 [Tanacetum coccineum]